MKKSVCLILSVLFIVLAFTSCASQEKHDKTAYLEDSSLSLTTPKAEAVEKLGLNSQDLGANISAYVYPEGKYATINNVSFTGLFQFDDDSFLKYASYIPADENLSANEKDKMKKYLDSVYGESQEYANEYDETGVSWTTEVDGKTFQIALLDNYQPFKIIVELK